MSKRKSRPYTTAAVILVLGSLIGFFFYMWNHDYKVARPREFSLKRDLRMALRIDQRGESGYGGPVALVTLANATQSRVRVLDTQTILPLYELSLAYKPGSGEAKALAMRPDVAQRISREGFAFDKEGAISELVVGAAVTKAIPLNHYFDLREKGNYELTLKYDPERVAVLMGAAFDYLDVTREALSITAQFQYPEPAPEGKSAERIPNVEPVKTQETNSSK